jgi:hypothetical protein
MRGGGLFWADHCYLLDLTHRRGKDGHGSGHIVRDTRPRRIAISIHTCMPVLRVVNIRIEYVFTRSCCNAIWS